MKNTFAHEAMMDVFNGVLQEYAFLFADPFEEGACPEGDGSYWLAGMRFAGPFHGTLRLFCPEEFAREVAAGVLGADSSAPEAQTGAPDALKELLNVICGNLLTLLAGKEAVFELSVPEVETIAKTQWRAGWDGANSVRFLVEEWPVALELA